MRSPFETCESFRTPARSPANEFADAQPAMETAAIESRAQRIAELKETAVRLRAEGRMREADIVLQLLATEEKS